MPIRREKTKQQTEMVTSSGFEASPYVLNYIVIVHSFLKLTVTVTLKMTSWWWSKQFVQSSRCWRLRRWSPRCAVREQEKKQKKVMYLQTLFGRMVTTCGRIIYFLPFYILKKKNALNTTTATAPVQLLIGAFTFQWVKPYFETVRKIFCLRTFFLTMKSLMPFSV